MDSPLIIFAASFLAIALLLWFFLRDALKSIATQAKVHAQTFALAYVKGGALIIIAMLSSFEQAFQPLTAEMATHLSWWDWAILFFKPIAAGFAVLVAFLDKSTGSPPPPVTAPSP